MRTPPAAALRQMIRSVAPPDPPTVSDRELLDRFVRDNDQDAFAILVRRHAGMVLGVCRRGLPTLQDAEDACQATFLLLARKANGTRWQSSVANWLYATARRVTQNARVAAQRRGRREARAAVPEAVQPVDRMTGRELLAALDEELDRLSACYREPLVLCYLEGLTQNQAAERLGLPVATLNSRVARGRKRLHDALMKSGVCGAGLLALAATSPARASSPRLCESILAAASGHPPAAVAALVEGVAMNGIVKKAVLTVLAVVGLVALGISTSAAINTPVRSETEEPKAAALPRENLPEAKPAPEAEGEVTYAGRVVDPDGKPVAEAQVTVVPVSEFGGGFEPIHAPRRTGADGRFSFKVPKAKILDSKYPIPVDALIVTAPGFYPGWDAGNAEPDGRIVRLQREDARVRGRVVNLEGRPVVGATVRVTSVLAPTAATLDPWLAALKAWRKAGAIGLEQAFLPGERPVEVLPGVTRKATTDAEGRFELSGYGKERVLKAVVEGPTITSREVRFVTRPLPTVLMPTYNQDDMPGATAYYGTNGTHPAEPTRLVTGVVRDRETNRPVAGVVIKSLSMAPHGMIGDQFLAQTTTDAEGRFTLVGMPRGEGNSILAVPDERQPYTAFYCDVPNPPGYGPVPVEIGLVRGVWVEGTVTDKRSGKPVRRAVVEYYPNTADARTAAALPGVYDHYYSKDRFFPTVTREDGTYRILALRGKGCLAVRAMADVYLSATDRTGEGGSLQGNLPTTPHIISARGYHAVYEVDVSADASPFRRPVTLAPGRGFVVAVAGPEGKPLAGVKSFGSTALGGAWAEESAPGRHTIEAYNPGRPRLVLFRDVGKNLVGTLKVPADFAADAHTVTLSPGSVVAGRVVDGDGRPKIGADIVVSFQPRKNESWHEYSTGEEKYVTGAGGRFRVAGLVPGFRYGISVNGLHVHSFTLEPAAAEEKDVGDIRFDPQEK